MIKEEGKLALVDMLSLALRVFRTRPSRTFLTIFGMAFGVGVVLFLVSLGFGLQQLLIGNLASTEDALITLDTYYPPESRLKIESDTLVKLKAKQGVAELLPVAELSAELRLGKLSGVLQARIVDDKYYRLSGTEPDIVVVATGDTPGAGLIVTASALHLLNLPADITSLGHELMVSVFVPKSARTSEGEVSIVPIEHLRVTGIISDENEPPLLYLDAKSFPATLPFYERVLIKGVDIAAVTPLRDKLTDEGFSVSARLDLVEQANAILRVVTIVLGIFGVAALIVSAIGMMNTMIIGFLERIYEVGIMKAIGATDRDIRNIFLVEAFTMGFLGGVGGMAIGTGAGYLFNFGLNILAANLGGKAVVLFERPSWFLLLIIVVASVIGLLSGIVPAMRASRLSPKEAFTRR